MTSPHPRPDPFIVAGPTGVGKSAVAVALARRWRGEIVNGDAFQVYREIPILTAAPEPEPMAAVPHHLYGIISIGKEHDASRFLRLVEPVMADIRARGRLPLVVGGSGLYIKALTHGLSPLPPANPVLRARLEKVSLDDLVAWLERIDPKSLLQLGRGNRRHLSRALEICLLSGRKASEIKSAWNRAPGHCLGVFLHAERELLYRRINARTEEMVGPALRREAEKLGSVSATGAKAIGLRDIAAWSRKEITRDEAVSRIQQATRRYAKRQMTWFRKESCFQPLEVAEDDNAESIANRIIRCFDPTP